MQAHMKRCGGCYWAYYCSPQCQKYAWTHGHREECGPVMERRRRKWFSHSLRWVYDADFVYVAQLVGGYPDSIPSLDQNFICHGIGHDIKNYHSQIDSTRDKCLAAHPFILPHRLVIEMNYTVVPVGIKVFPAETYKDKRSVPNWDDKLKAAAMGHGSLILAVIPESETPTKFLQVVDMKKLI